MAEREENVSLLDESGQPAAAPPAMPDNLVTSSMKKVHLKALGDCLNPEKYYYPYVKYWDLLAWAGIFIEFLAQCLYSAMEGDAPTHLITTLEFLAAILLTAEVGIRMLACHDFFFKKSDIRSLVMDDQDSAPFNEKYEKALWWHKIKYVPNVPNYFDLFAGPGSLLLDTITFILEGKLNQVGSFMRIFRVLTLPGVRDILFTSIKAVPKLVTSLMGSVALLFMCASIARFWFHEEFPDEFGNLMKSLFELFVVATLDQWSATTRDVWEVHPHSWIFFVLMVLLFGFIMLNIFMGVVLGAFLDSSKIDIIESKYAPSSVRGQIHDIRNCMNIQRGTFAKRMVLFERRLFLLKKRLETREQDEAEK